MNNQMNPGISDSGSQTHLVHATMRLLRILRHRKVNVIACVLVAGLLGTLYYVTAVQRYVARTSLMVLYQGSDDTLPGTDGYRQGMLPTYERLLYSSVVLEGAASELQQLPAEYRADLANVPRDKWVESLRRNLSARAIRSTNFIEVSYLSTDPHAAVAVINAIIHSYLKFIEENQKNVAAEIVTILDKGRSDVAAQLTAKEKELLEAKRQIGDLGLREGARVTHPLVHNVVRINESLMETRQERMRLEASLGAIREAVEGGQDLRHFMLSMDDAGGRDMVLSMLGLSARDDEFIRQTEQTLSEQRARFESVREFYGDAHPSLLELKQSIRQQEQVLSEYHQSRSQRLDALQNQKLGSVLLATLESKLATAIAHEQSLQRELVVAQREAVELNGRIARVAIIEHDLMMLRELHDTLRNRIANLDIKQDQTEVRLAVVSEAKPEETPVSPRLFPVFGACLLGGLAVGGVVAYVRDVLDDRFRSSDELRDQLGVNVLAIVRQLPDLKSSGLESLQVFVAPNGVESESFRTLRSTLAFSDQGGECVAISSSEPGDGKTTVLSNLGVASAQAGKQTLLIDADMRRPGLTRLFGLRGSGGLSDVLRSQDDLNVICGQQIRPTGLDGLDLLPAGALPTDPGGLLSEPRFAEVVAWACGQYDQVLIDTPPILAARDAAIVARLTGGIVLVVQPAKNHRRLVHRAVDEVRTAGLDVLGVVLNRISVATDTEYGYAYGYGHGYGHGYHDERVEDDALDVSGETQWDDDPEPATLPIRRDPLPPADLDVAEESIQGPSEQSSEQLSEAPARPRSPWVTMRRAG